MSYKKISGTPNIIKFSYNNDTMFEKIQLRSMYKVKSIKDNEGEAMIDEYGISEDEELYYDEFISDAVYSVFEVIKKMVKTVTNSVIVPDSTNSSVIAFSIIDRQAYDENMLPLCDQLINTYIKQQVLTDWFKDKALNDLFEKSLNDLGIIEQRLVDALFELKKPLISS